ncbi:MAG: hypothetical protein JWM43_904 [Acidobacteriaceae bacterium]|nr:hypothetical protein [Acidobacteriaceae bacterium]
MSASVRQRFSRQYWLGVVPALVVIFVRNFIPQYLTDEPVRLVSLKRVFDHSFLSQEWLQLVGYDEDSLSILFKSVLAPLWLWLKSGILVAMSARLIVWAVVFYAIVRLARAMNVPRYGLACGLFYWVWQGQSMGVGEWILGGGEGKCLAYAAIFLALESLLRGRRFVAAFFCGLAFWFHVPVGLWGVLAFYGALFVSQRERGLKAFLQPALLTLGLSLPMAWFAWKYAGVSAVGASVPSPDWLIVVFRNPHHLDPRHFGGWRVLLKLILLAGLTVLGLKSMVTPAMRRFFSVFMAVLMLEVAFGVIARELNFFVYLKTYPFRVADVLIFFLCCLVLPKLVVDAVSGVSTSAYFAPESPVSKFAALAVVAVVFIGCTFSMGLVRSDKFFVQQFATSWGHFLRHETSPYQEMTGWIKANTPISAVVIAPPWMDDFPLEAERAPMVSFRRNPHNGLVVEWFYRYRATNGGDFHSVGVDTVTEVQKNYPQLTATQLDEIRKSFGGEYYLTSARRDDLADRLVHANGHFYLYRVLMP